MIEKPIADYLCDTKYGDGHLYFYNDRIEWKLRGAEMGKPSITIKYADIKDIDVVPTKKKTINVRMKSGEVHSLFLYRDREFFAIVDERMDALKKDSDVIEVEPEVVEEDNLDKLERLAKLHKEGSLTDEEFKAAKAKILGL